jgi:hypothetical protein
MFLLLSHEISYEFDALAGSFKPKYNVDGAFTAMNIVTLNSILAMAIRACHDHLA